MALIPQQLNYKKEIIVHGELFTRLDLVDPALLSKYSSARHFTAGQLNRTDADTSTLAVIDFFPWSWINTPYATATETLQVLTEFGFNHTYQYTHIVHSLDNTMQLWQSYSQQQDAPFLMDGIVLKADSHALRSSLGWTNNHPRWALAWKFPASTEVTEVQKILFNIGRTGQITPVLEFVPVNIKGETIRRVSLGSVKNLRKKNVAAGDQISIQLKGAATPVFYRVILRSPDRKLTEIPDLNRYSAFTCLTISKGCEEQFVARLIWLVGGNGLKWEHMDQGKIRAVVASGKLNTLKDIFIYAPKNTPSASFTRQLRALSLPEVGRSRAQKLAAAFPNWKALQKATDEELAKAGHLNQKRVQSIRDYLTMPEVAATVKILSGRGDP